MECTHKTKVVSKTKVVCNLKNTIFNANGMIYYTAPTSLHHANNEFYGKLIIVSEKKDMLFCKSLINKYKRIYIFKKHFTEYIINGTLEFLIKII